MMNIKLSLTLALVGLLTCASSIGQTLHSGFWTLTYDNGLTIERGDQTLAERMTAEYVLNGKTISTLSYDEHVLYSSTVEGPHGSATRWNIIYTDKSLPKLTQYIDVYDNYLLTSVTISSADKTLSTNRITPICMARTTPLLSKKGLRSLFVPFDNDAWVRYDNFDATEKDLHSYEVTAVYDHKTRRGVIIGAIDHDQWKNAIDLTHGATRLKAYSGVADKLTRDKHAHGMVKGKKVRSATFMIGLYNDWRDGMEAYADANARVAPPRKWDKAMPVGWNSWGALAFNLNHDNAIGNADFFAQHLQNHSFHNSEGLVYTGLDSGWNSMTEEELTDFARHCEELNQVPCIYWTPFTDWGKRGDAEVPGSPGLHYRDIWLLHKGKPQELDGAYAIDPTHPAVRKMMEQTADLFRRTGYKYVKMDFMTHGRMEADGWYDKNIQTGTEAYNYGMHLLDSIFHDMYINLSISPIFPAQYAQSRRIACDAWNKIKDTEYTLNALSYGWWIDRVYQYNDADHVVLREATEGENRARVTSSVITGLYITGDDFSEGGDSLGKARALTMLTNEGINRLANGRSFQPFVGDKPTENVFIRRENKNEFYLAVFNYSDEDLYYTFPIGSLPFLLDGENSAYVVQELWSREMVGLHDEHLVPGKDVKVFRFRRRIIEKD